MSLGLRSILFVLFVTHSTLTIAATPEEVEKAYENCVVQQSKGRVKATPEENQEWAVQDCTKRRNDSCPTADGRWCDGWVRMYLREEPEKTETKPAE